jgi:methionine biosynthesis protein MetW
MVFKDILYTIKEDLKKLRMYPEVSLQNGYVVDYEKYWKKRGRSDRAVLTQWQKDRADRISKMVSEGDVIIDVGCGDASLLKYLIDKAGVRGIGIDISEPILENAKKIGIETIVLDITKIGALSQLPEADYIMGLEILEHMPNPEEFIMTMRKKVRKGMIFSFPNTGYYQHRMRLLFGSFPLQWILHPGEHLRYWTARDARFWVRSLGFNLDTIVLYQGIPFFNRIIPTLFGKGIIIKITENNEK